MSENRLADQQRHKERGIALATTGLLLALCVLLALRLLGLTNMNPGEWALAATVTLVVQAALWLGARFGVDRFLRWDPHYLLLPTLAAAGLLTLYIHYAVEARVLFLMAWFVALLFLAGFGGVLEVAVLSLAMVAGYIGVVTLHARAGADINLDVELITGAHFLLISLYAGVVLERLRRDRREMIQLRAHLAEMALTDELTRLPNRRRFEEILRTELARLHRFGGTCALAMIDVDEFKACNDTLGHVTGDAVLAELATLMRSELRLTDVLARYGGEEFALIMVNTPREEAYLVVERLRRVVESHVFTCTHPQPSPRLTISVGIAVAPNDAQGLRELVRRADDALYTAKREGRNRVHFARV